MPFSLIFSLLHWKPPCLTVWKTFHCSWYLIHQFLGEPGHAYNPTNRSETYSNLRCFWRPNVPSFRIWVTHNRCIGVVNVYMWISNDLWSWKLTAFGQRSTHGKATAGSLLSACIWVCSSHTLLCLIAQEGISKILSRSSLAQVLSWRLAYRFILLSR